MIPTWLIVGVFIFAAVIFLADPNSRRALRGEPPLPKPMSLTSQKAPDTRPYFIRYLDSYFKIMGFAFVALVIIMPIVMTTFFHLYPDAFK